MTTPVIPSYPASPSALLRLLLSREKARLLGPVIEQAITNDESRATETARDFAIHQLGEAEKWVDLAASFEGY